MDKEKLESLVIDFIDGRLTDADRVLLEKELAENPGSQKTYEQLREVLQVMGQAQAFEPTGTMKARFERMLRDESVSAKKTRSLFFNPVLYRAAAALLLVAAGVTIGMWIDKNRRQDEEIQALQNEVAATKRMMLAMLDNPQSASQRIQAVNVASHITVADDEVVNALVKTMNEDANTNVRMAALDALSQFIQEPLVRKELIRSLAIQKDPVVQIALIQLMVKLKEKGVVKDLENIIDDTETLKAVKDEAYSGILKLS